MPYASLSVFIYIFLSNTLNLVFYANSTWSYTYIYAIISLLCFILNTIYIFRKFNNLINYLATSIFGVMLIILMIINTDGIIYYLLDSFLILFYLGLSINTLLLIKNKGV